MERLNIFNTHEEYNVESDSLPYPSVSYIAGSNSLCFTQKDTRRQYITQYLTFEALQRGSFTLSWGSTLTSEYLTSVSYSIDNGETWVTTNNDGSTRTVTTPTVDAGSKVLWKGIGKALAAIVTGSGGSYSRFSSTCRHNVSGNLMSLLYGDDFLTERTFPVGTSYNFYNLFYVDTKLISAENLIFPATVTERCYYQMFNGCTALTKAPSILPAKTLVTDCYLQMFNGCTSLTQVPKLPATTLETYCYASMFQNCTSLTQAPSILPATTLAEYCYQNMFFGCTKLTAVPELPATILANYCYNSMFYGCTSLTQASELPATTLAGHCYQYMFSGCTSLTAAPALPATTLSDYCYYGMFQRCTSLTTTPELPATILANYCYSYMFNGCTNLNYIKAMFTTTPSGTYTSNWVNGVASNGTFIKNSAATWNVTGTSGIPSGWTIENETIS